MLSYRSLSLSVVQVAFADPGNVKMCLEMSGGVVAVE
jgi:hypothetical protein